MTDARMKQPGPDHPITITRQAGRVVVRLAGQVVADSDEALVLQEATLRPVHYIPRKHVAMEMLSSSDHATYCPYKGEASYFSLPAGGERGYNAAWSYEAAYPAVAQIAGHIAFYADRVDAIEVLAGSSWS